MMVQVYKHDKMYNCYNIFNCTRDELVRQLKVQHNPENAFLTKKLMDGAFRVTDRDNTTVVVS